MAQNGETREAERRRTILRAAIEVFAKKGYHGCRIADVAREAGVAYGLVYHYFQNKEELLGSVFEATWSGFVDRVKALAAGGGSLGERVHAIARVSFEAYQVDPRAVRVLILEIARSPAGGKVDRGTIFAGVIRMIEAMFRKAQANGELRQDADPLLCAALLFGAIEMGLTLFVLGLKEGDPQTIASSAEQLADNFLKGVAPTGNGESWKTSRSSTKPKALKRA